MNKQGVAYTVTAPALICSMLIDLGASPRTAPEKEVHTHQYTAHKKRLPVNEYASTATANPHLHHYHHHYHYSNRPDLPVLFAEKGRAAALFVQVSGVSAGRLHSRDGCDDGSTSRVR